MINYRKLWLLLYRRGFKQRDIISLAGISESTYQKLAKDESVRLDVLVLWVSLRMASGKVCRW